MKSLVREFLKGACVALALAATPASAIPLLQLYAEGSTYDAVNESWVLSGSPGDTVRIWVIANIAGEGSNSNKNPGGAINDVHLLVSFNGTPAAFTLSGTTVGGTGSFAGFTDPSTPANVSPSGSPTLYVGNDIPTLFPTANSSLQNHQGGVLAGPGPRFFYDFGLGDFTLTDSPLTDFNGSTNSPTASSCLGGKSPTCAQINVYEFTIPGGGITDWHFDVVGYSGDSKGAPVFQSNPYSHDADGVTITIVPAPATLLLLGIGLAVAGWTLRKRD